jgi:hypothetical protein
MNNFPEAGLPSVSGSADRPAGWNNSAAGVSDCSVPGMAAFNPFRDGADSLVGETGQDHLFSA